MLRRALPIVLAALTLLSACGGPVVPDAPALLSRDELAARADIATDTTRGTTAAQTLAWRGERLRARAAQMRRIGLSDAERRALQTRADDLKAAHP